MKNVTTLIFALPGGTIAANYVSMVTDIKNVRCQSWPRHSDISGYFAPSCSETYMQIELSFNPEHDLSETLTYKELVDLRTLRAKQFVEAAGYEHRATVEVTTA